MMLSAPQVAQPSARRVNCSRRSSVTVRCQAASTSSVESIKGLRPEIEPVISSTTQCLTETSLSLPGRRKGKVRDTYDMGSKVAIVTTDRMSAFDRHLASIPFKGQVLNMTSAWWMEASKHIVPNALICVPDPNVTVMKKCKVFPIEFVVRGFLTGSTDTSLWTHYKAGERNYCGNDFPDGLKKNDRLTVNVITPTTKSDEHDVPIGPKEIVSEGHMSQADWDVTSKLALALFKFGQEESAKRDMLLVDTKYEFGKDEAGNIMLIDEVHTPDSSRYWIADTYMERHAAGLEPENIDKEFLRLWFRARCDPYKDAVVPDAPRELVVEMSRRYVYLYEKITGEKFVPPTAEEPNARMQKNLADLM